MTNLRYISSPNWLWFHKKTQTGFPIRIAFYERSLFVSFSIDSISKLYEKDEKCGVVSLNNEIGFMFFATIPRLYLDY